MLQSQVVQVMACSMAYWTEHSMACLMECLKACSMVCSMGLLLEYSWHVPWHFRWHARSNDRSNVRCSDIPAKDGDGGSILTIDSTGRVIRNVSMSAAYHPGTFDGMSLACSNGMFDRMPDAFAATCPLSSTYPHSFRRVSRRSGVRHRALLLHRECDS